MAVNKRDSAASRRRVRLSGWVLSQFQVTLALCGVVVGFLVCFGLGFLSGVWFQTQEQMMPHDDAITLADNQLEREREVAASGQEMTFYSALPSRDGTPESVAPSQAATVSPLPPEPTPPKPASTPPVAVSTPTAASDDVSEPAPLTVQDTAANTASAAVSPSDASPSEALRESSEDDQATTPPEPQAKSDSVTVSVAKPDEKFYSVQVGSFRKVEQAYRLQDELLKKGYQARIGFSIVEGKGAWYRVRVGRFEDRGSANKTAQRLQKKEKVDVLVMRVSS